MLLPGQSERLAASAAVFGRIGLERRDHVDPVERRQLVEVHDVIVHRVRRDDQVARSWRDQTALLSQ